MSEYLKNKREGGITARTKIEESFADYKGLLADKTHPDNQTAAYDKNVKSILNRLLVAADELDSENPGEGIFGLIVLALRTNLKVKDQLIELEVEVRDLKKEVSRLKKRR